MASRKKILIATEYYYPIVTSTGYYMTEIAEYIAERDIEVHVVCTGARYNETTKYELKSYEEHNKVYIHRVLTGEIDKNNFFKRGFRLFLSSFRMFFKLLTITDEGDTLLVVTNPAFLLLLIPIVKKIKKTNNYLLVHDIFPENLAVINKIRKESGLYKLLSRLYDKAYANFDTCISIGRDMSNVLRSKTGNKAFIELIPNWADTRDVFPMEKKNTHLYNKLNLQDKFIFQFAGNLGNAQGLDNILEAIRLVNNPHIHFLFIGGGAKYESIKYFSEEYNNTSVLGFQDRSEQNDFLNACDVAIVTLNDGMYGLGVPSKSYNIMATGKPILMIGEADSEIGLCIQEYQLGWIVEPNNPQQLKETIEDIYKQRKTISLIASKSRFIADTIFAKEIILEKYYRLLNANI